MQTTANTAANTRFIIAFLLLLCSPHARKLIIQQETTLSVLPDSTGLEVLDPLSARHPWSTVAWPLMHPHRYANLAQLRGGPIRVVFPHLADLIVESGVLAKCCVEPHRFQAGVRKKGGEGVVVIEAVLESRGSPGVRTSGARRRKTEVNTAISR
jgi:hypothetical protein